MGGDERLPRTGAVAAMIGLTPRFVQREVRAGRLRATEYRTGSRPTLRFRVVDVRAWTARHSVERNGDQGRRTP